MNSMKFLTFVGLMVFACVLVTMLAKQENYNKTKCDNLGGTYFKTRCFKVGSEIKLN